MAVWYMTYARYQDDAYISLTYARNLLAGDGLTWSGERIEGYSNFLFVMLTALLGYIGIDLKIASNIISFASYFGLVAVIHRYGSNHYRAYFSNTPHSYAHHINHALCTSLVASSAIILAWCSGGLEAVFFTFLLTGAICCILRWIEQGTNNRFAFITGSIFALAAMTRVEAIAIWGITGLFLGACWLFKKKHIHFSQLVLLGLGFILIFAPYMGWRLWYFGEWLPNTYWAKVYGIPEHILSFAGSFYFLQFALMPPMLTLFAIVLAVIILRNKCITAPLLYLCILAFVMSTQVILSGGDHMQYLRFCVPIVPVLALIIYYCNTATIALNEKRFRDVCGALIVFSVMQFGMVRTDENLSAGAASGEAVADYVKTHWPKNSLIALNPAGALPYLAEDYRYLDMLGLLDKHIARRVFRTDEEIRLASARPAGHQKGDGRYVLSRNPDYIIFSNAAWGTERPLYVSDIEIAESVEFKQNYKKIEAYITPPQHLLPILRYLADESTKEYEKQKNNPDFIRNPVMNDENQLRFIYYQRKKDG
ncbi:MAG: hypothetical protein ACK502_00390 [Alphaproteobacteria bacterium]